MSNSNNNILNSKIGNVTSPNHNKSILTTTETNPQSKVDNLSNKFSNSFIRTATLPKRFKDKFLNKSNLHQDNQKINNVISSSINSLSFSSNSSTYTSLADHQNQNNKFLPDSHSMINKNESLNANNQVKNEMVLNLNKLISKYFKTIKYLEQIIIKNKLEIIASSITATLESVLDIYNLIQTSDLSNNKQFKQCRDRINKSLANLIKWSDSILLNTYQKVNLEVKIIESSRKLIKNLNKSIRKLVKNLNIDESEFVTSISSLSYSSSSSSISNISSLSSDSSTSSLSVSISPQEKASSLSSNSSYNNNNKITQTVVQSGLKNSIEDNKVKTIKKLYK
jgi:hypothetical protein